MIRDSMRKVKITYIYSLGFRKQRVLDNMREKHVSRGLEFTSRNFKQPAQSLLEEAAKIMPEKVEKYEGYFHEWIVHTLEGETSTFGLVELEDGSLLEEELCNIRFISGV